MPSIIRLEGQFQQRSKVGYTETCDRIPSDCSVPVRSGDDAGLVESQYDGQLFRELGILTPGTTAPVWVSLPLQPSDCPVVISVKPS